MATADAVNTPAAAGPTGHPTGFWFFFWGEFAERSSYYGMRAILALYMTQRLGVDKADAGTFVSFFIAACYILPLLGGYLADTFFGKYWTIVGFSLPYVVGQLIIGIENQYVVLGALCLLAMGSGVIKPNISTLMGMTYDQQRPGQEQLRSNAFSWFYLAINIGAFCSQLAVPWLRTHYSYQVAFLFPAGLMVLALLLFAAGKRFYAKESIEQKVVGNPGEQRPDGRTVTGLPVHYKVVTVEQKAADRALKVQTLVRIGSLFLLTMFFWAIFDQSASTWIFFADTFMDCHLFGIAVTADQIQSFNALFIVVLLPLSVVFFNAMAKKGKPIRATDKMLAGFALTALSMFIMSSAGFLAGAKQVTTKVTLEEGVIVLPDTTIDLGKEHSGVGGNTVVAFHESQVMLVATDWKWDAEKKKAAMTAGWLELENDRKVWFKDGRIDFDKSRDVFTDGAVALPGVLELQLKPGTYRMGNDQLTIGSGNAVSVKPNTPVEVPAAKDPPKVTLEETDWVKPAERVTVWWQVLAYLILTIAEILISVTGLELAFVVAPPTMKSFVTGCWLFSVGLANLVVNAPITRLYPHMKPGMYFALLGVALVIVGLVFIPVAAKFNRTGSPTSPGRPKEGDTEAV